MSDTECHTPGPWTVFGESEARFNGDHSDQNEYNRLLPPADGHTEGTGWPYIVASPDHGLGYGRSHLASGIQSRADADLIAAAPDMLTALHTLKNTLHAAELAYGHEDTRMGYAHLANADRIIEMTIARATRTNFNV
jgi:hypothetical protein